MTTLADSIRAVQTMSDLDRVYAELRASWQTDWMGLPKVLECCCKALFTPSIKLDPQAKRLLNAAHEVTSAIELHSLETEEPAYHNRLHIADALVGLTSLLKLQTDIDQALNQNWVTCMLLAVSAHDFKHPGGANAKPHEIESQSLAELTPWFQSEAIDLQWQTLVHDMIWRTDPLDVPHNHALVQNTPFDWTIDWACVLLNEADILASASVMHGPPLSESLAAEWKRVGHPLHSVVATAAGRQHFLKSILFSSPASLRLGVAQTVQQQLQPV